MARYSNDEHFNATFWADGKHRVIARVVTTMTLVAVVTVIAGLAWLAISAI